MSHPVYLVTGEAFLIDEALAKVRSEVGTDALSEISFSALDDSAAIMSALQTPSLLGDRRLVVVRDAGSLKKEQVAALEAYMASPSPHAVLVLVASGRTKLAAAAKKAGTTVDVQAPKGRRLVAWVRARGKERGLKLDERAGWTLIDAIGNELRDLDAALEQLATSLGKGVSAGPGEVRRVFPRLADERIFAFTDAVGERRLPAAMTALRRLLEQGDEPLMIFGALSSHVRRLLVARPLADRGPGALAGELGMPEWRAEKLHRQVRAYREEELAGAMGILADTDVEMKGGDLPPEIVLERAVIQIVTGTGGRQ
jgi:DNA polymerase-3 subunit delta